jgi:hypothetical protein
VKILLDRHAAMTRRPAREGRAVRSRYNMKPRFSEKLLIAYVRILLT